MKGIQFRIEKVTSQIQAILIKPAIKLTPDIFQTNFARFCVQVIQIAEFIINQCDLQKHLPALFQRLTAKIKQSRNHKPHLQESEESIPNCDDQITQFLNSRRPVHHPKNLAELDWYVNHMQKKEKDTQIFLDQVNKLKSNKISSPKVRQIPQETKTTQTDLIWVNTLMASQGSQITIEKLTNSLFQQNQQWKQNNERIKLLQQQLGQINRKNNQESYKKQQLRKEQVQKQDFSKQIQNISVKNNKVQKMKKKRESIATTKKMSISNSKSNKGKKSLIEHSPSLSLVRKQQKEFQSANCTPTNTFSKRGSFKSVIQEYDDEQIQALISKQIKQDGSLQNKSGILNEDTQISPRQINPQQNDNNSSQILDCTTFQKNSQYNESLFRLQNKEKINAQSVKQQTMRMSETIQTSSRTKQNYQLSNNRFFSINEPILEQQERPTFRIKNQSFTHRDQTNSLNLSLKQNCKDRIDRKKLFELKTSNHQKHNIKQPNIQEKILHKIHSTIHKQNNTHFQNQGILKSQKDNKQNYNFNKMNSDYFQERYKIKTLQNRFNTKVKPIFNKQKQINQNLPSIHKNKKMICLKSQKNQQKSKQIEQLQIKNIHIQQVGDSQQQLSRIQQDDFVKKDTLILNKIQQLHKNQKLGNHAQIKFYVEMMEKMHKRFCGKQCKHLQRFYKHLKMHNIWNNRIPISLPTRKIGFFS